MRQADSLIQNTILYTIKVLMSSKMLKINTSKSIFLVIPFYNLIKNVLSVKKIIQYNPTNLTNKKHSI